MAKKKIVMAGGGTVLLAGAAFAVVALMGVPKGKEDLSELRGTDAYYVSDQLTFDLPDITVNLKGAGGQRFLTLSSTVVYRIGSEIEDGNAVLEKRSMAVGDRLLLLLSDKTPSDLEGFEKKNLLKEEIRETIQRLVFPEKKGRIEDVLFRDFKIQ